MILLFTVAATLSTEVLAVPKRGQAVMAPHQENTGVDKLRSGLRSSMSMNQPLNRNTHKIRLCTDRLTKMCGQRLAGTWPSVLPRGSGSVSTNPGFAGTS